MKNGMKILLIVIVYSLSLHLSRDSIADSIERKGCTDSGVSWHIKPRWKYITSKKTQQRWPLPPFHPFTFAGKLLVAFVSTALSRASEIAVLVQQKKRKKERGGGGGGAGRGGGGGGRREREEKKQSATTPLAARCVRRFWRGAKINRAIYPIPASLESASIEPIVLPIHSLDFPNAASIPRNGLTLISIPNRKNFIWMNSHPRRDEFVACIDGRIKSRRPWLLVYLPLRSWTRSKEKGKYFNIGFRTRFLFFLSLESWRKHLRSNYPISLCRAKPLLSVSLSLSLFKKRRIRVARTWNRITRSPRGNAGGCLISVFASLRASCSLCLACESN